MEKYIIHVGKRINIDTGETYPILEFEITEEILGFIDNFADVIRDSYANKIYKINNIEFTVHPKFDFEELK